jgi:hypothetical protein
MTMRVGWGRRGGRLVEEEKERRGLRGGKGIYRIDAARWEGGRGRESELHTDRFRATYLLQ